MAKVSQRIKLTYKASNNSNAKYTITYKKVTETATKLVDGKPTKYSYTTYKKVIVPKKLSYM